MTRDEVLLWLNDRIGKLVHVEVLVERGDRDLLVLVAEGELQFWREGVPTQPLAREDLIGYYRFGDATVDLTDLDFAEAREWPDLGQIEVGLADGVRLQLVEIASR